MSLNTTIETAANSARDVAPEKPEAVPGAPPIERWLHGHLTKIAVAITAGAFAARIVVASRSYLNPDEALHYLLLNEPSLFLAYKASLTNAHPPLIYLLLYICHFVSHSELMLRLPSILAGTAFCWFTFKWIRTLFGEAAGLIAVILAAFSPTLIALSAEVREYALLLCCMAAALYFLERAFAHKSVSSMWLFSVCLYLAILSHYSAAFFCLAAGVSALARISDSGYPRKIISAWVIGQMGALTIYVFLYVTHLSKIRNNLAVWGTAFGGTFYRFDQESIFHFTKQNTWNIFQFLFAQPYVAGTMLIGFVAGTGFLLLKDFMPSAGRGAPRHASIYVLLPFFAVWAAAVAGIYPYIGSRHTAVLIPSAIAAASFLFASVSRQKLWAGALLASLLMGVSNYYGKCPEPGIRDVDQRQALMTGAMNYLHQSMREDDVILADMQSSMPLGYYYCGAEEAFFTSWTRASFDQFRCHGHLIVSLHFWLLRPEGLTVPFEKMVNSYGLKPGNRVWVFQAGWGGDLIAELPKEAAKFQCLTPRTFGQNITIVPLMVGSDLSPAPQTKCVN
jgi:hypothetical protein